MARIERFEEIKAWQIARELVKAVYTLTRNGAFAKDFGLRDNIQRAAVSVMSNIAEGFERNSKKEFVHFLYIARGSAGEVRSQLYVASDLGYMNGNECSEVLSKAEETSRTIYGLIAYLETAIKEKKLANR
jgi:four helix bundle protein